jgi:beta-lactamase class A
MTVHRRTLLAAAPMALAWPALAAEAAPEPLAAYERASGGRVGLFALNIATRATLAWRADERFVMCSTFKASLAALVLARAERGLEKLDRLVPYGAADLMPYAPVAKENLAKGALSVEALCKAAVELSDNTCANLLLTAVGGPAALTAFWRSIGDQASRLDHNEPMLNRSPPGDPHDTTTPAAMAGTLRRLVVGDALAPADRARLKTWMLDCQTGANRLRAGIPTGWAVADKTGSNGKDASGDIAIVWPNDQTPIVICAYTQGGSPTADQTDALFREIGKMVAARLG